MTVMTHNVARRAYSAEQLLALRESASDEPALKIETRMEDGTIKGMSDCVVDIVDCQVIAQTHAPIHLNSSKSIVWLLFGSIATTPKLSNTNVAQYYCFSFFIIIAIAPQTCHPSLRRQKNRLSTIYPFHIMKHLLAVLWRIHPPQHEKRASIRRALCLTQIQTMFFAMPIRLLHVRRVLSPRLILCVHLPSTLANTLALSWVRLIPTIRRYVQYQTATALLHLHL